MIGATGPLRERLRHSPLWVPVRSRDLTYVRTSDDDVLVVGCDSDGGLGPKPADTVPVEADVLGRFAVRVPLLEVLAAGASPFLVVDTLAVERDPTGAAILAGVLAEAAEAGLGADAVTGSTEDNVPTVATGVGVTVLGRASLSVLRAGTATAGNVVVQLGRAMSAPTDQFGPDHPEILTVTAVRTALAVAGVVELLPIGSGGVAHELTQLAAEFGCEAVLDPDADPARSGGPSTAALVALDGHAATIDELRTATGLPVTNICRLLPR